MCPGGARERWRSRGTDPLTWSYLETIDDADNGKSVVSVLAVFHGFHDMEKTPGSYYGIGMTLWPWGHYEEALKQCDIGLSLSTTTDRDRSSFHEIKGFALYEAAGKTDSEEDKIR